MEADCEKICYVWFSIAFVFCGEINPAMNCYWGAPPCLMLLDEAAATSGPNWLFVPWGTEFYGLKT